MQGRRVITLLVPESLEGRPAVRDSVGAQNELSGDVGAGDGGMGADRERGPPFDSPSPIQDIEVRDIEPEASPASPPRDFRITEAPRIGQGGFKEKARDNVAAIRMLRRLAPSMVRVE
jgi:hypothetical protein